MIKASLRRKKSRNNRKRSTTNTIEQHRRKLIKTLLMFHQQRSIQIFSLNLTETFVRLISSLLFSSLLRIRQTTDVTEGKSPTLIENRFLYGINVSLM